MSAAGETSPGVSGRGRGVSIERLCIVGVGLIGGSLARDLKAFGLVDEVVGSGRREENLERARALGVIDRYDLDCGRAVRGADLVLVAVPIGAMGAVFRAIRPHLGSDTVVSDVGSSKQSVVADAAREFGPAWTHFVPGHPIAGTEQSGVKASQTGLFRSRRVILTPTLDTAPEPCARVRAMWEAVGAEVLEMDPAHHDEVLAATSHLPHMLAYALMDLLGSMSQRVEIFRYAAGGLRDFTRIASSDPQMWHDTCIANREALLDALDRFARELSALTDAVRAKDGESLHALFARAKRLRDTYIQEAEVRGSDGTVA